MVCSPRRRLSARPAALALPVALAAAACTEPLRPYSAGASARRAVYGDFFMPVDSVAPPAEAAFLDTIRVRAYFGGGADPCAYVHASAGDLLPHSRLVVGGPRVVYHDAARL